MLDFSAYVFMFGHICVNISVCVCVGMCMHVYVWFLKQYKDVPRVFSPFLITNANVTLMKSA